MGGAWSHVAWPLCGMVRSDFPFPRMHDTPDSPVRGMVPCFVVKFAPLFFRQKQSRCPSRQAHQYSFRRQSSTRGGGVSCCACHAGAQEKSSATLAPRRCRRWDVRHGGGSSSSGRPCRWFSALQYQNHHHHQHKNTSSKSSPTS